MTKEQIYNQLDDLRAETVKIIENRGLYERGKYESMLSAQYHKEMILKKQLMYITIQSNR